MILLALAAIAAAAALVQRRPQGHATGALAPSQAPAWLPAGMLLPGEPYRFYVALPVGMPAPLLEAVVASAGWRNVRARDAGRVVYVEATWGRAATPADPALLQLERQDMTDHVGNVPRIVDTRGLMTVGAGSHHHHHGGWGGGGWGYAYPYPVYAYPYAYYPEDPFAPIYQRQIVMPNASTDDVVSGRWVPASFLETGGVYAFAGHHDDRSGPADLAAMLRGSGFDILGLHMPYEPAVRDLPVRNTNGQWVAVGRYRGRTLRASGAYWRHV